MWVENPGLPHLISGNITYGCHAGIRIIEGSSIINFNTFIDSTYGIDVSVAEGATPVLISNTYNVIMGSAPGGYGEPTATTTAVGRFNAGVLGNPVLP